MADGGDVKPAVQHLNLKVKAQDGTEVFFKVKKTTPFRKLMEAYCQRQGVPANSYRFLFDGERLRAEQTPADVRDVPLPSPPRPPATHAHALSRALQVADPRGARTGGHGGRGRDRRDEGADRRLVVVESRTCAVLPQPPFVFFLTKWKLH